MTALIITSSILFVAALVFFLMARSQRHENQVERRRLDGMNESLIKRETACREAMKRNGAARLELDKREFDFDTNHKVVTVECADTQADVDKCPSVEKRLAMAKSRLAHKIGYKVLEVFPLIDVGKDLDGPGSRYHVSFLIRDVK